MQISPGVCRPSHDGFKVNCQILTFILIKVLNYRHVLHYVKPEYFRSYIQFDKIVVKLVGCLVFKWLYASYWDLSLALNL